MKFLRVAAAVLLSAAAARGQVRLQGAGATFPNIIYQRWVTEYQKLHPDVRIDYQSIGSGGGIKGITEKSVDFGATDVPLNAKEIAKAQAGGDRIVQIPTVGGAVVLAYNVPTFTGELKLDGPVVAQIFLGKITRWNDPAIMALNAGAALPNLAITPVHQTDGSGATWVFTNYVAGRSEEFEAKVGAGKEVRWPAGSMGGKGCEGVTAITGSTTGAIGYIELAFALQNKIPFALIKNRDGKYVRASTLAITAATEGAAAQMKDSLVGGVADQAGTEAYPICGLTYVIVYKDLGNLKDPGKARALVSFLTWAETEGQKMAPELDYGPLGPAMGRRVMDAIGSLTWNGKPMADAPGKPGG